MPSTVPVVSFDRPQTKALSKSGLMAMDLHFHTEYSADSIAGPQATLKYAKKLGVGLAVTDHNAIGGSLSMVKNRYKVPVIPGIELTGKEGTHMLYLFYSARELEQCFRKEMKPYLKKNPFVASKPTLELLEDISRYNCVISAPHPYSPGSVGIKKLTKSDKDVKKVHAVEVINGYNLHNFNLLAGVWMRRSKKGATGGTDGHMVEELGRVATFAHASTVEDFLDAIAKRQTSVIGREDPTLRKILITLLKEHEMVSKSAEYHVAKKLFSSQYHSSHDYYEKKLAKLKKRLNRLFSDHHGHSGKPLRHPFGGSWTRSKQLG